MGRAFECGRGLLQGAVEREMYEESAKPCGRQLEAVCTRGGDKAARPFVTIPDPSGFVGESRGIKWS